MEIEIEKAVVLVSSNGPDKILLYTTMPSPFPRVSGQSLMLYFDAEAGTGVDYVREHFFMESEVIHT